MPKHGYGRSYKIPLPGPVKKYNQTCHQSNVNGYDYDEPTVISVPKSSNSPKTSKFNPKPNLSEKPMKLEPIVVDVVQVQTKPIGVDSRVIMTNKACTATSSNLKLALKTGSNTLPLAQTAGSTTSPEEYNNLLLEQYGFNPSVLPAASLGQMELPMKPIEKAVTGIVPVLIDYSSQCVNETTDTGTNGTAIDMAYNFSATESPRNGKEGGAITITPKDIEISNTPRLKVIAEKFTRFKKDHIELRRLDERIICVEYDVYCKQDLVKLPVQVMRAYFCVKTNCRGCQNSGIFKTMPASDRNSPLTEDRNTNELEKEVEMIEENLPENKPYIKDLKAVLKKRQAMSTKKKKSSLDLMSMYNMAKNEMPPRDHDWSNTNLLSKAELMEVKDLIMKRCESRMYTLSRKTMKNPIRNQGPTGKTDSFYTELIRDLDALK